MRQPDCSWIWTMSWHSSLLHWACQGWLSWGMGRSGQRLQRAMLPSRQVPELGGGDQRVQPPQGSRTSEMLHSLCNV